MVKIITDSACDIDRQKLEQMGVQMLPISVHFGGKSYAGGVDLDNRGFYDLLKTSGQVPKTSQIPSGVFEDVFRRHLKNDDEVVGIFLSSKLSGTVQSANIARAVLGSERIFVVDSLTATFGQGLLVQTAVRLRDRGLTGSQIAHELGKIAPKINIFAFVDSLRHLKQSGRLSAASLVVGSVLNITPLIRLGNGMVEPFGKTRGREAAIAKVAELYKAEERDMRYPIAVGHADAPQNAEKLIERLGEEREGILLCEIGGVICSHIGLGAAGVAYVGK